MKRYFVFITVAMPPYFCPLYRSGGSSAPAPTDVRSRQGWSRNRHVDHGFRCRVLDIPCERKRCYAAKLCLIAFVLYGRECGSPASVSSLYNGYLYSFSVNGRRSEGREGRGL